ncbi:hypothetical protein [Nostoc sp. NMS7]|nr:hypothetical protein [Nostoc sp. NMS7]
MTRSKRSYAEGFTQRLRPTALRASYGGRLPLGEDWLTQRLR